MIFVIINFAASKVLLDTVSGLQMFYRTGWVDKGTVTKKDMKKE